MLNFANMTTTIQTESNPERRIAASNTVSMKNIINLSRIYDPRGSLTVVESLKSLPFEIGQVNLLNCMTPDSVVEEQCTKHTILAVPLSGSFRLDAGQDGETETVFLNRPYQGYIIDPTTPYRLYDFTYGAVCLLVASR